jgi:hypothetical protein
MLVVCYTNHALDQFLEGILQITDSIARVGARGKSETLERFNLKARKRSTKESLHCRQLKDELKEVQAMIEEERKTMEEAGKNLHPNELEKILVDEERKQLEQWERVADQMRVHEIDAWLKMQDEADNRSRNKRKRSSSESDEKKYNKSSRNTSDGTTNVNNLNNDALNPSSMQRSNTMCPSEKDVEEKTDRLNEMEEGELPESDDEVFFQINDTSNEGSRGIHENNDLKTADQNNNDYLSIDERSPNLNRSENKH